MRENRRDDNDRTSRLLDSADVAFDRQPANGLAAHFEDVVMEGLMTDKATSVYPPTGHNYPKRG